MSVKFAVVREDPIVEKTFIERASANKVLMVASGGCTALSLKALFPEVQFTLFDMNSDQIQLVQQKRMALGSDLKDTEVAKVFNIGIDNKGGLNSQGEFESLFRSFRQFVYEFVVSQKEIEALFVDPECNVEEIKQEMFSSKYWPVAFKLYFSDALLVTMFGPDAVQHATSGSYPAYFQAVIELGLKRAGWRDNYFLHHILLGYYLHRSEALPAYLQHQEKLEDFNYIHGALRDVDDLHTYQVISVSNIFDWMGEEAVQEHLLHLEQHMRSGAYLVFRQLNNTKAHLKGSQFEQCFDLAEHVMGLDKSLFYNQINILRRK